MKCKHFLFSFFSFPFSLSSSSFCPPYSSFPVLSFSFPVFPQTLASVLNIFFCVHMVHMDDVWMMKMNCFCGMVDWQRKAFSQISSQDHLTISNLQHTASRIWTCRETEFRLCWMKLCTSDNHYLTALPYAPLHHMPPLNLDKLILSGTGTAFLVKLY